MITILNRIKAIIFGHAVGDALGVPVEFMSRTNLINNPIKNMIGFGTYNMPIGTWSDDTSMSVCAIESLSRGSLNYDDIMQNFCKWLNQASYTATNTTFDVGNTCKNAIYNYKTKMINALECGEDGEYSNGNGSLMRIYPFTLYAYFQNLPITEKMLIIENGSKLTHRNKRSIIACQIYSFILWELFKNQNKNAIYIGLQKANEFLKNNDELNNYYRIFESSFDQLDEKNIKSSGYVVDTLEAVIWCLLSTNTYSSCVLKAVNLGGDTDTIAAICGSLAGLLYGYKSIPTNWLNNLKKKEELEKLCSKFCANISKK